MSRRVFHDGQGQLLVRFGFDRRLVELVRTLPSRRWNAVEKHWSVPERDVVPLVELLSRERFLFDETTRRLYHDHGGTLPLGDIRSVPEAPSPGGLFDNGPDREAGSPDPATDYTVERLNLAVKAVLAGAFPAPVWLIGEMSGFNKSAHKRHVGFNLVEWSPGGDQVAQVNAILFEEARREIERRLTAAGSPFRLEDEVQVRVRVSVDLYEAWGQFRVRIEDIDLGYTLGEAARRREEIVRKIAEAGLLGRNTALPFPALPLSVGLVTSLGSDAHTDVVRHLKESGFAFRVTVHGARVQGRSTEPSVLNALEWFRERAHAFDVVLICRGGGSRTDLSWFDSESLGRMVALFPIPVVIGIGHEQDQSVLDFVGWRCKTPTAAADLLVETVAAALRRLDERAGAILDRSTRRIADEARAGADRARRLVRAVRSRLDLESTELRRRQERTARGARAVVAEATRELARRAVAIPRAVSLSLGRRRALLEGAVRQLAQGARRDLATSASRLSELASALGPKSRRRSSLELERTESRARRLELLDPRRVVDRGYCILRRRAGAVVRDPDEAPPGSLLRAELSRGVLLLHSEGPEG